MKWAEEVLQKLYKEGSVITRPPGSSTKEPIFKDELIEITVCKPDEVGVGDLVLAKSHKTVDVFEVRGRENNTFELAYPRSNYKLEKVEISLIYGKVQKKETLFTREQLLETLGQPELPDYTNLLADLFYYGDEEFIVRGSEESLWVLLGRKNEFANPLNFWIGCLQYLATENYNHPEFFSSYDLCEFLPLRKVNSLLEGWFNNPNGIKETIEKPIIGEIKQAQLMFDEWNDQAVLLKTASEFVAIFWETTA
jgi:hypothetical protein